MAETSGKKQIITAALPYVNNLPHLGNVVGALLSADVYNRYSKMRGNETVYICGTDEYGTASEVSADKEGKTPAELCADNSKKHKEVYDWFQIECDVFGRTSCERHKEVTQKLFTEMWKNDGFIEKEELRFFCEKCSMFLADRYINGVCALCKSPHARGDQCDACGCVLANDEILEPICSTCKSTPEKRNTKHLFYCLDKVQSEVHELIDSHALRWSPAAKQIACEWKAKELIPRCITRDLKHKWGVPVPLAEYEGKVLYVWFDAPIGYITFTDLIGKISWWSDPDVELYQFMGKDNVFFHSVFFPAMLLKCDSVKKYPKMISSTHYLTYEGDKFSKSHNRGIFGHNLLNDAIGPAGIWRFHLMRRRPETGDSDFSWREFHESLNAVLINTIGNLCHRILSFISKRLNKRLNSPKLPDAVVESLNDALIKYIHHMETTEIRQSIECIISVASIGNAYIQKAFEEKVDKGELGVRMSSAANILLLMGRMMLPVVPAEAQKLIDILRVPGKQMLQSTFSEELLHGHEISEPSLLFTPLTNDQISQVEKFCLSECPFVKRKE
ncbi:methionyl-tRNA synthetase [Nematocida ausubeli]|nr:methionyl-tRNA synthetase [Nematocida ausubeli]